MTMEPVTALARARRVRKPKAVPKYRVSQDDKPHPHGFTLRPCGTLTVDRAVDLDRAMKHWADKWQHADPLIGFDDLNPCRAIWSRRDTGE